MLNQGSHRPKFYRKSEITALRSACFITSSLLCQQSFLVYISSPGPKLLRELLFSVILFFFLHVLNIFLSNNSNWQLNMLKFLILHFFPLNSSPLSRFHLTFLIISQQNFLKAVYTCYFNFLQSVFLLYLPAIMSSEHGIMQTVQWAIKSFS